MSVLSENKYPQIKEIIICKSAPVTTSENPQRDIAFILKCENGDEHIVHAIGSDIAITDKNKEVLDG